MKGKTLFVRT